MRCVEHLTVKSVFSVTHTHAELIHANPQRIISYVNLLQSVINARGTQGAVRGVTPQRDIRMRERAYNFSAHYRVGRGASTVLY
jgi:hypothetical protein